MDHRSPTPEQIERYREVFDMVADPEHWKNPIDACVITAKATPDEITDAVVWFTGSVPTIGSAEVPGTYGDGLVEFMFPAYHVKAAGYYATIGA